MYSIRLNKELEQKLDSIARQRDVTRTEVVREALEEYVVRQERNTTPYELGKKVFGRHGSGETTLSKTYKSRIKEKVREKHTH